MSNITISKGSLDIIKANLLYLLIKKKVRKKGEKIIPNYIIWIQCHAKKSGYRYFHANAIHEKAPAVISPSKPRRPGL